MQALIRKLENFAPVPEEDRRRIAEAVREVRDFGPRQDVILEGDRPGDVHLMVEGWAVRYKVLRGGSGRSWPT